MTVETITGASDETALNIAWPKDTDFFREGAGHIRILKQLFKNLFEDGVALEAAHALEADNAGQLGEEDPAYYLSYDNFTDIPATVAPSDATVYINTGDGLEGGSSFTLNGESTVNINLEHEDTSTQNSVSNSGNNFIKSISLDAFGHITNIVSDELDDPTIIVNAGAVGSYAMLRPSSAYTVHTPGETVAGGTLRYSSSGGYPYGNAPSGTWRCMGYVAGIDGLSGTNDGTIFQRIS